MKAIKIIAYCPSYREAVKFKATLEVTFNNVKIVREESAIRGGDYVFLCFNWIYELIGSPYVIREAHSEDETETPLFECFDPEGYDCCGERLLISQAIRHTKDYQENQ